MKKCDGFSREKDKERMGEGDEKTEEESNR